MPAAAHDAFRLRHRFTHLRVRARLYEEGIENPGRVHEVLGRRECGHDDKTIERESHQAALLLDDADHAIGDAADAHVATQWRAIDEQALRHGVTQHGHRHPRAILLAREGPAHCDAQILDVEVALTRRR